MEISNDRLEVCLNTLQLSICDSGEEKTDRPDGSHASDDFGSEVSSKTRKENKTKLSSINVDKDKAKSTEEKEEKATATCEFRKQDKAINTEDFKHLDKATHEHKCSSNERLSNIEKLTVQLKQATEEKDIQLDLIHRDLKKCLRTLEDLSREMRVKRRYEEDSDDSIDE
ncbi:uncharacterized protein LOC134195342 isoform X2 [Corticium candelabrum]|uniref:uncharacterized protein LOC134195342 isoform X2 n=1 Tax=Corticium candelabrum TaxID=121492 RepID=UPI002E2606C6|nr:uncharacterized protein LOC134195342 isoform X2 [Corticium candelabrum]